MAKLNRPLHADMVRHVRKEGLVPCSVRLLYNVGVYKAPRCVSSRNRSSFFEQDSERYQSANNIQSTFRFKMASMAAVPVTRKSSIVEVRRKSVASYEAEFEKPVPVVDKIDYSGAHAKTDPKEIALVRKLDRWIMACRTQLLFAIDPLMSSSSPCYGACIG